MTPLFQATNLSAGYDGVPVLHELDFHLAAGELLGVLGPNGSGKSTLIRVLTRLIAPMEGTVQLNGKDIAYYSQSEQARRVAVVPQTHALLFSFTVREIVEMGRYPHSGSLNRLSLEDEEIIASALAMADIEHLADREADHLSGGELQRVILARALAQRTEALLLDEPTAHLDLAHQLQVFELLLALVRKENLGVLAVIHDLNLAAEFCDRLILLSEGRIIAEGPPDAVITEDNLRRLYRVSVAVNRNPFTQRPLMQFRGRKEGDQ